MRISYIIGEYPVQITGRQNTRTIDSAGRNGVSGARCHVLISLCEPVKALEVRARRVGRVGDATPEKPKSLDRRRDFDAGKKYTVISHLFFLFFDRSASNSSK